ncbi:STAS domain-containing protein [Alkalicoccobacillus gibsonii]|uniref:STAS domain-containing protein n=1 Tax=Alkalicoccobacillus gibsonii TaxID=79881 RepID=UPI001933926F|nr:STAS domain-containing protein [Alkalicoccobacillus gibsonii]MBM0066712.1 STAS domain-containing protein [Alkalicoccobacillus gibsonii]
MVLQLSKQNKALNIKNFQDFEEVATQVLLLLSHQIQINTLFIAKNDLKTNRIMHAINKDKVLLRVGEELDYTQTLCKLSVDYGERVLVIPSLSDHEEACDLDPVKQLGTGSFIGIPIYDGCGGVYGTICGLDDQTVTLTDNDIELFRTMASLLSYVLDLESAHQQLSDLSAPLVPVAKGIGVLPVIGNVTTVRMESIVDKVMTLSSKLDLHYLLIDVSGIVSLDESTSEQLLRLAHMLKLIGVKTMFTGIRPDLAMKINRLRTNFMKVQTFGTLAQGLESIGFIPPVLSKS